MMTKTDSNSKSAPTSEAGVNETCSNPYVVTDHGGTIPTAPLTAPALVSSRASSPGSESLASGYTTSPSLRSSVTHRESRGGSLQLQRSKERRRTDRMARHDDGVGGRGGPERLAGTTGRAGDHPEDDDNGHDDGSNDNTPKRRTSERRRRRRRVGNKDEPSSVASNRRSWGRDWLVWAVLMFGVVFSLFDTVYIVRHLEATSSNSPDVGETSFPLSGGSRISNDYHNNNKSNRNRNRTVDLNDLEPILRLIRDAGIAVDPVQDADLIEELPTWSDVTGMYGEKPVLYGLKEGNCQRFQTHSDPGDHLVGTAGTFNSGTNLLAELMIANCRMLERQKKYGYKQLGVRWQVPWGKHTPPGDKQYRETHKASKDKNVDANEIMPAVTIRDPLVWLKSMCRHHYTARWYRPDFDHCPDFTIWPLNAAVKYSGFAGKYKSILHLWNDYYQEYLHLTDLPFVLVRYEDLVFHPEETTKQVCECAGGTMRPKFKYIVDSAKKGVTAHGKLSDRTGYVDAIVRYGSEINRYNGYTNVADLEYIRDNVDPELMELMKYPPIDPSKVQLDVTSTS